jgi:hypothetical protein
MIELGKFYEKVFEFYSAKLSWSGFLPYENITVEWLGNELRNHFLRNRGKWMLATTDFPEPPWKPPCDGKTTILQGRIDNDGFVYGESIPDVKFAYKYKLRYDAGFEEIKWLVKNNDGMRLTMLLNISEELLRKEEPAIWFVWEQCGAPLDIGRWWHAFLTDNNYYVPGQGAEKIKERLALAEAQECSFGGEKHPLRIRREEETKEAEAAMKLPLVFSCRTAPSKESIPGIYCGLITGLIMADPVVASDGYTYERETIEKWLCDHDWSYSTRETLPSKELIPNKSIKAKISAFLITHPQYQGSDAVYLPINTLIALKKAIINRKLDTVKTLIDQNSRILARHIIPGRTAFHLACERGSAKIIAYICAKLKPAQLEAILALPTPKNWKPFVLNRLLLKAAKEGNVIVIKRLLQYGASIETRDLKGKTALCHAAKAGKLEAVCLLLEQGANETVCDEKNKTPIDWARLRGHQRVVDFFLKKRELFEKSKTAFFASSKRPAEPEKPKKKQRYMSLT